MANKGREYAENLVGALDRSAYNQQRDVAQNTYSTNWQNVQNQYKNLQDKLKLQQQRANTDFAEGLINAAENSFNRERQGSGNLANRGLSASGLTNMLEQSDIEQKGEEIGKLLKGAGNVSVDTASKLSEGTTKFANEGAGLMDKLADTLGDIGDAETTLQNKYNNVLAGIAGAMDEREANNELQAMQRASSGSGGKSKKQKQVEDKLEDFYKRAAITEILNSNDINEQQKANTLGIMFGIDNARDAVRKYESNVNLTEKKQNRINDIKNEIAKQNRNSILAGIAGANTNYNLIGSNFKNDAYSPYSPVLKNNNVEPASSKWDRIKAIENTPITYQELNSLLYGKK